MKNPRLEWLVLMNELNNMVYELQYEQMCEIVSNSRLLILSGMESQMEKELDVFKKQIEKSNEMINNSIKNK